MSDDDLDFTRNPHNRRSTDSDERTLDKILGFERSTHEQVSNMSLKIPVIELEQKHILSKLESLVSKLEFKPIQMLVYGMTAIILTSVIGALVALVVNK